MGSSKKSLNKSNSFRLSKEHRASHSAKEIKQKVEQLIADFKQTNKASSTLCRKIIRNFETVYNNWEANIFTCYEYDFIPNDNNSLESNHNKVKRAIRKITGNKSTAQSLLVYGEEFILCQEFYDKPLQDFHQTLSEIDFKKVTLRNQQLKEKQKKRGLRIKIVNKTDEVLKNAYDDW